MILPNPQDTIHLAWLLRVLTAVADDIFLAANLRFKGGTCAAIRGFIERFSVDLDFDLLHPDQNDAVKKSLRKTFQNLGLTIDQESQYVPQFFLKYETKKFTRNTMKFDVTFPPPQSNIYEAVHIQEIDRILYCQTLETMFSNKLVAVLDRYEKHGSIAGRDIFDIHSFFLSGTNYLPGIILERTHLEPEQFFKKLKQFIETRITQQILDEDLNYLLPPHQFKIIRKNLKNEVLALL